MNIFYGHQFIISNAPSVTNQRFCLTKWTPEDDSKGCRIEKYKYEVLIIR